MDKRELIDQRIKQFRERYGEPIFVIKKIGSACYWNLHLMEKKLQYDSGPAQRLTFQQSYADLLRVAKKNWEDLND